MATMNPYLNFNGNTEEAFNFYKSVFGGEFAMVSRFKDVKEGPQEIPESDKNKIMHISLPIGKNNILMANDILESIGQKFIPGNNFSVCIDAESKEEADKFFKGLSAGGKITMPLQDMFWGAYFGMFTDKFGIQWMVNYGMPKEK